MGSRMGSAAALLVLLLTFGVADAGGGKLAVSTVTVQALGKGTVTSSPAGVSCGNGSRACYVAFSGSGTARLTATPASGWSFDGWTGCPAPSGNTCDVPVNGTSSKVTASFAGPPTSTSTLSVTTTGKGSVRGGAVDCGSDPAGTACSWTALTGSTMTVLETPAAGNVFSGWGGACSGTGVACTVELTGDRTVSAGWTSTTAVLLTATVSGSGTITGGGLSCPSTCSAAQAVNSTVVLTAAASAGYTLTGWGGACSGTSSRCAVLMDAAKSVSAEFTPVVQLSVDVSGPGNVAGEGGAINCGNNATICTASVALGKTVSLVATPATGATLTGWSGACGGTVTTCTILMDSSKGVTATFSGNTVPLTVSVTGPGTVTGAGINCGTGGSACTANVTTNTSVTLTATPSAGATFAGWSGACSSTITTCTVSMTAARSVTATFTSTVALGVSVTGPGTVTGGGVTCGDNGSICNANVATNSSVTLTATPSAGATFTGWGGACSGAGATCTLVMSSVRSVVATFVQATYALTVNVTGRGTVASSSGRCSASGPRRTCVQTFPADTNVVLTATPAKGVRFKGWSGACTGTKRACTVAMDAAKSVSATFTPTRTLTISVIGRGSVSSAAGTCGATGPKKVCVQSFPAGARVVVRAKPATGARFAGWRGACTGNKRTCTVSVTTARSVTAAFSNARRRRR